MMKDPNTPESRQSPDFPDAFYRVVVKGGYVRDGKVLLCYDHSIVGREPLWELPGGGLDFGESFAETLKREAKEEMNLEVTWIAENPAYLWTNRAEKIRGMDWWYALVLVFQFDLKNLEDFIPSDECRELRFFSKEEMKALPQTDERLDTFVNLFNPKDFV